MRIRSIPALSGALSIAAVLLAPASHGATHPDVNISTSYTFLNDFSSVFAESCGQASSRVSGCFGATTLGPFGHIGGLIEGYAIYSGTEAIRNLYIVDVAAGSNANEVVLYRYQKIDNVIDDTDYITYTLTKHIVLPLVGGANVLCSIAANTRFVVIGTDASLQAARVHKGDMAVTQIGEFTNSLNVTAITADDYDFITITFGTGASGGFSVLGPDGTFVVGSEGRGPAYATTSKSGLSTKGLPNPGALAPAMRRVRTGDLTRTDTESISDENPTP